LQGQYLPQLPAQVFVWTVVMGLLAPRHAKQNWPKEL
jgi:hypothetical protein